MNFQEFRSQVLSRIGAEIEKSNCSTFKIMGYKYLDIRLILYFDDCHQVIDFQLRDDKLTYTKFFTKDKNQLEKLAAVTDFKSEIEKDKPE